jgi:hypothetical protein
MQAVYGRYFFPSDAAEVTSRTETEFSYSGRPIRYRVTYSINVTLLADGQTALSVQENLLRDALSIPYQDFSLLTDAGQPSSATLLNRNSATGVRLVSGPDFKEAQAAEFVNRRTAEFELAAEYIIKGAENAVVSWTESVSIVGDGGPRRFWRFPMNADPIRQVLAKRSLVRATQSGSAVGHTRPPPRPLPIWPDFKVSEGQGKVDDTPDPKGRAYLNWPVKWSYAFESGFPLVGLPSLPPV